MIDHLVNSGCFVLREGEGQVIVVLGPARSGTSMVAGVLHHLGVFCGQRAAAPVFEDLELAEAWEGGSDEQVRTIIDRNSSEQTVWAFKRPSLVGELHRTRELFPDARLIACFRDPAAIAARNVISMESGSHLEYMRQAQQELGRLIDFLEEDERPALVVSTARATHGPEATVQAIVEFCALAPSPGQLRAAVDFITPNPDAYLVNSRVRSSRVEVDCFRPTEATVTVSYNHPSRKGLLPSVDASSTSGAPKVEPLGFQDTGELISRWQVRPGEGRSHFDYGEAIELRVDGVVRESASSRRLVMTAERDPTLSCLPGWAAPGAPVVPLATRADREKGLPEALAVHPDARGVVFAGPGSDMAQFIRPLLADWEVPEFELAEKPTTTVAATVRPQIWFRNPQLLTHARGVALVVLVIQDPWEALLDFAHTARNQASTSLKEWTPPPRGPFVRLLVEGLTDPEHRAWSMLNSVEQLDRLLSLEERAPVLVFTDVEMRQCGDVVARLLASTLGKTDKRNTEERGVELAAAARAVRPEARLQILRDHVAPSIAERLDAMRDGVLDRIGRPKGYWG